MRVPLFQLSQKTFFLGKINPKFFSHFKKLLLSVLIKQAIRTAISDIDIQNIQWFVHIFSLQDYIERKKKIQRERVKERAELSPLNPSSDKGYEAYQAYEESLYLDGDICC